MELTKNSLESIRFKTKGKWYDAIQVDDFIDEVIEKATELNAEKDKQDADMLQLQQENYELKQELESQKQNVGASASESSNDPQKRIEELENENARLRSQAATGQSGLEAEKSQLVEDIKVLRNFRDEFKKTLKSDAEKVIDKLNAMDSDDLI